MRQPVPDAIPPGPLAAYRARIEAGELAPDPAQERAVVRLQALHERLLTYDPRPASTWRGRLGLARKPAEPPRGLYLHGGVGRGKSMLMDLFAATAPVAARRRVHFHAFMLEVHRRLHGHRRSGAEGDPILSLADGLSSEARLLCFDELAVINIADAMILGRLFEALLERGVVMVATSNFAPARLYEDGLRRELFLPFIALIEERLEALELDGEVDHRLRRLRALLTYHSPLGPETDALLEEAFQALTDGASGDADEIEVGSRVLKVPRAANGVAFFAFGDLCERALGAADYLALSERYHTLVLAGVPRLTPDRRNEARRFMTLVDVVYERRRNLVVGAEAEPDELYARGDGAFEFRRTASRLHEMRSEAYVLAARRQARAPAVDFRPFALTSDLT